MEPAEGKMKISSDGKSIKAWNNESGHYKPSASDTEAQFQVLEAFKRKFGMDLPAFEPFYP